MNLFKKIWNRIVTLINSYELVEVKPDIPENATPTNEQVYEGLITTPVSVPENVGIKEEKKYDTSHLTYSLAPYIPNNTHYNYRKPGEFKNVRIFNKNLYLYILESKRGFVVFNEDTIRDDRQIPNYIRLNLGDTVLSLGFEPKKNKDKPFVVVEYKITGTELKGHSTYVKAPRFSSIDEIDYLNYSDAVIHLIKNYFLRVQYIPL